MPESLPRVPSFEPGTVTSEPLTASLGILGGTFNPPHIGHMAIARHARAQLGLDRVVLMPSHTPPHKPFAARDPGPEHRLAMCRLAVRGEPGIDVSALEIERGGLSFTVDTLRDIHAANPYAPLTLIVGADIALTLPAWREPEVLLEQVSLAVAMRSDTQPPRVLAALEPLGLNENQVRFLNMPPIEVSSSMVRERLSCGEALERPALAGKLSVASLLSSSVADYIQAHGLYSEPAAGVGG